MNQTRALEWCDRVAFFGFCGFIYFLPISIALIESFASVVLVSFFVKRGILFTTRLRKEGLRALVKFFNPVPSFLNASVGIFIFVSIITVLTSQYFGESVQGFFFKILEWTFLCFIFFEVVHSQKRLKIFIGVWTVSALIAIGNGLFQRCSGYDFIYKNFLWAGRISSSFRHSNDFGAYLVIVTLLAISLASYYVWRSKAEGNGHRGWGSRGKQALAVTVAGLSLVTLGLTLSRGAWLGFMVGILFLLAKRRKINFLTISILIIVMMIVVPKLLDMRRTTIWETYQSGSGRTVYWQEAWHMIRDFPVFGVGLNSYSREAPKYKDTWGGYPHNCYLQMTVETGLVGLLSFLLILFVLFRRTLQSVKLIKDEFLLSVLLGLSAGLLGFLVHSFFDTNFYSVQLGNLMWVVMGAMVAVPRIAVQDKTG